MKRIVRWTAAALLTAGIGVGGYVANSQPDHRPGPDVKISVLLEDGNRATCSGVYLGDGVVLTAKHCVTPENAKVKSAVVIFDNDGKADGAPAPDAAALWTSDKTDIAAYKIAVNVDVRSAELACRDPKIGEPIEVVGNPLGVEFVHTWGKVAGVVRTMFGEESIVPIDVMVASGNSGGPVFDAAGKVLGIVVSVIEPPQLTGLDGMLHPSGAVGHVDFMVSSQAACDHFGPK